MEEGKVVVQKINKIDNPLTKPTRKKEHDTNYQNQEVIHHYQLLQKLERL